MAVFETTNKIFAFLFLYKDVEIDDAGFALIIVPLSFKSHLSCMILLTLF